MAVSDLGRDVRDRAQRRQPQLPAPALGTLDAHHRAAAGGGDHRAVDGEADEHVGARAAGSVCRGAEQEEEGRGHHQREDHGAPVAEHPADLQARKVRLKPPSGGARRSGGGEVRSSDAPGLAVGGEGEEGVLEAVGGDLEVARVRLR